MSGSNKVEQVIFERFFTYNQYLPTVPFKLKMKRGSFEAFTCPNLSIKTLFGPVSDIKPFQTLYLIPLLSSMTNLSITDKSSFAKNLHNIQSDKKLIFAILQVSIFKGP